MSRNAFKVAAVLLANETSSADTILLRIVIMNNFGVLGATKTARKRY
jgi:hypothetical protein